MLAIIFRPDIDRRRGHQLFFYPIPRVQPTGTRSSNKDKEIELATLVLRKGVNFVEPKIWESAVLHPPNKPEAERLLRRGVVVVYVPDSEEISGSTTDFKDLVAVEEIIESCSDKNWLERCRSRDPRIEVDRKITTRLTDLAEEKKAHSNWTSAMV